MQPCLNHRKTRGGTGYTIKERKLCYTFLAGPARTELSATNETEKQAAPIEKRKASRKKHGRGIATRTLPVANRTTKCRAAWLMTWCRVHFQVDKAILWCSIPRATRTLAEEVVTENIAQVVFFSGVLCNVHSYPCSARFYFGAVSSSVLL